ncbi:type I-E CRISPR-associated protein Cas7/Cse4/CasC [Streptomyces sp. NPDC014733]|uniref:type I-E CRISPR-associated protein Cas7/Cse4/CasC n=1 Tax=Streptomyces sp. NPDC014733 TaxID=3364885 RepID=UPI0036FC3D11
MAFLCLHAVQTIPYANLNRDDLGAPKTLTFGGTTRIRLSSQALGRPLRDFVQDTTGIEAVRTRRIGQQVQNVLTDRGWDEKLAASAAQQVLGSTGFKLDKDGTKSLLFVPASTAEKIADLCETHRGAIEKTEKSSAKNPKPGVPGDEIHALLKATNGSIALFGRMLSELPGAGVDAARQMAHGFTTHTARRQPDFFVAVDDVTHDSDETGSGHMNHGEYASGVFYRYAVLDLRELLDTLNGDTETARLLVDAFTRGFIKVLPQAKKNVTAPHTIPDLVHFTVRADQPVNYATAFERPIAADDGGGWARPSRAAFSRYATAVNRLLGADDVAYSGYTSIEKGERLDGLGDQVDSYKELTTGAIDALFAAQAAAKQ